MRKTINMSVNDYPKMRKGMLNINTEYDECPWCGEKMIIQFGNSVPTNQYSYSIRGAYYNQKIYFQCPVCKATSPFTYLNRDMINKDEVKESIKERVVTMLTDDIENECKEDEAND